MLCQKCNKSIIDHSLIINHEADKTPVQPKAGDLTFCAYCGTMYEFDTYLKFRLVPPDEEQQMFDEDDELRQLAIAMRSAIEYHIKNN